MSDSSAHPTNLRPHPLAVELARLLQPGDAVLDFAAGRGRNAAFLRAQGFEVDAVSDEDAAHFRAAHPRYRGALSTHGLLHGMPAAIEASLREIANAIIPQAAFYTTFASVNDPRCGEGTRLADRTFAPDSGEERGVPHTFFGERGIRDLVSVHFTIESMEERTAEHIPGSVHWFVRARRRER